QVPGAARTALDAWQLAREWRLDVARLENDFLDEARHLYRWGTDFERTCATHDSIPEYRLAERVLDALRKIPADERRKLLPARVLLAGFLDLTPALRAQWDGLAALGVEVATLALPDSHGEARRLTCADVRDEHQRIASWAARRLE